MVLAKQVTRQQLHGWPVPNDPDIYKIKERMIRHYMKHNKAGESPRKGTDGGMSPDIFKIFVHAYNGYKDQQKILKLLRMQRKQCFSSPADFKALY